MVIYERIHEPRTRTIKYLNNYDDMLQDIIIKLRDNKKIFIFYPFKKVSGVFNSMENLFNLFRLSTNKNGKFYNADVDDKLKIGLKDVNESWKDIDFIITNNIITCGVNYDSTDFDYKYIFIASHNSPRDSIQVSYRSRYLSSGIIYVCYLGKLQQQNSWLNDCNKMNCPIYNILYKQILIEKLIAKMINSAHLEDRKAAAQTIKSLARSHRLVIRMKQNLINNLLIDIYYFIFI